VGSFVPDKERGFVCFGKIYKTTMDSDFRFVFDTEEVSDLQWKTMEEIVDLMSKKPEKFKRDYKGAFNLAFGL